MKLSSGKRIGQSPQELRTAVSFSLILHILFFLAAVFVLFTATPRRYVPPSYEVALVNQPTELSPAPAAPKPPPPVRKQPAKKAPKVKKTSKKKLKQSAKKSGMPELEKRKQEKPPEKTPQDVQPATPAPVTKKAEAVEVKPTPGSEAPELSGYLGYVARKIKNNWKYHEGVPKDIKVKVVFVILRSGLVDDVKLEEASGIFHFDQAAIRAIRTSSPFPPFPEDVYRPYAVVSADLTPE